jgi:uridine phosphorylase
MMKRYFKGVQPHITIEEIEVEITFLPGPPERAFEIAKNFSVYEKLLVVFYRSPKLIFPSLPL